MSCSHLDAAKPGEVERSDLKMGEGIYIWTKIMVLCLRRNAQYLSQLLYYHLCCVPHVTSSFAELDRCQHET